MKVENMTGRTGREVANQFIIHGKHYGQIGKFFQSYNTVIAFKPSNGSSITIDNYVVKNPSKTTLKYLSQFLGHGIAETRKRINSGEYILANLN